jgi:hypothetical protein
LGAREYHLRMMKRLIVAILGGVALAATVRGQQPPPRPMSPEGSAQVQVLGKWVKPERPTFALGREQYTGGKWIEITYGRPLQRQRDLFGAGANYGKAINDVGTATLPPPPVWRAGANVSTRLTTEATLVVGDKKIPPGEYSLFIDVKSATDWTLIVSSWPAQQKPDQKDKTALWGAYGYTPDKDVARLAMKIDALPFSVEQLTWAFVDMTTDGGRIAISWAKTMASAAFKAQMP